MKKFYLLIIVVLVTCSSFGQLTGIKTIPGDYASIGAAISALNAQGVGSGGVTFNVAAGYTETASNLIITATGTLANPVVFQKSGSGADPLIAAAPGISTTLDGIIIFSGCDYITFNGIDITDPATNNTFTTQMEWGYALLKNSGTDGCQNITIMNCTITLQRIYTAAVGIYCNNHTPASNSSLTVTSVTGTNSNNKFYFNTIQNVNYCIQMMGFLDGSPYTYYDQNNDIGGNSSLTGNTFQDYGGTTTTAIAVNLIYQNGCNISYNTINNTAGGGVVSAGIIYGINHATSFNSSATITNNTITLSQGINSSAVYNIASSLSGTGTLTISDNIIQNASVTSGASGTFYCIYISASPGVSLISNNQFINCTTLATSGSVYFLYNPATTSSITISGNSINNVSKTSSGGTFYGYYNSSAPTGGTETVNGNIFSGITLTGATTFYGFNSQTLPSQTKNYYNNTVSGILGGSSNMYCFYNLSGSTNSFYSNNVFNITNGNGATGAGFIYGFNLGNATTVALNAYSNAAYAITNSNSGSTFGLYANSGASSAIYRNSIYNISGNNAASITYGIYIAGGTTVYAYNNFVSDLKTPISNSSTAVEGIYTAAGTNVGLYNNTIYLNASGTGTNFGNAGIYSVTAPVLDLRNNVVVNVSGHNGTGLTVAYRRSNATLTSYASTSNYNDFYAGIPGPANLLYYDGTNSSQTLSQLKSFMWQRDAQSVTENPPFVNVISTPYDLHVKTTLASQLESGGIIVSAPVSIIDDFDAQPRYPNSGYPNNVSFPASAPDIGADEFGGQPSDLTPPNISFTALTNTSLTTARNLTATITDPSGVPVSGAGLPVLYWKINSGSWTAATAVPGGSNQFTFTFGSGVVLGDVVSYYIIAQDQSTTPNVGSNPLPGAAGFTSGPPAAATPPTTPYSYTILGGVGGTVTVGPAGNYFSLTGVGGLFADINAKVVTSNITANIIGDLTEDGTNALNQWIEDGAGNYTLTIQPNNTTMRTIAGTAVATGTPMININGADRVSINGVSKYLLFRNTNATAANTGATLQFTNGAINNNVSNCIFENNSTSASRGTIIIGATGTNNVIITGNDIHDATGGTMGTPSNAVYSSSALNSINISSNNIYNFAANGINFTGITDGSTISSNSFYNTLTTPPATAQTAISLTSGGSGYIITGNYIGGSAPLCGGTPWINSGNVKLTGINLTVGATTATSVQNNTIQNITMTGTAGAQFYGINVNGGLVNIGTVTGNIIGHPVTANSISINGTGTSYGINSVTSIYACNFENNIISNLTLTGASGSPSFYGIYFYGANLRKNKIVSIGVTASALTPIITGFYNYGVNNATNEFSNNIISLDGGASSNPTIYGYYDYAYSTDIYTMYYNSISISGPATTTASTNVFYRSVNAAYTLKNNIFSNTRAAGGTGKHYVIDLSPAGSLTSNYNDLYSLAGPLGYWNADQLNLAAWQTASGGDANSVSVDPQFVSSSDLHTFRAELDNSGTAITGITTDYSGITRLSPPDMGAFEQPQVTTNPATGILQTGATLNGTVNACNQSATTSFEYGLTLSYGSTVAAIPGTVTGMVNTPVTAGIIGLLPNSVYHFRAKIVVGTRTYYGSDQLIDLVPLPTISGPLTACAGATGIVYSTQYGKSIYQWSISAGGTITGGGGLTDYTVTVTWNTPGAQTVSVNWQNSSGVSAPSPTILAVTVNSLPVPTITGSASVCTYTSGVVYTTETGMTGYTWSVPSGGTITAGSGTYSITVTWTTAGNQTVTVNYINSNGCTASAPAVKNVTVNARPSPTITGPGSICAGTTGVVYFTETGMTGYTWSVSSGGTITAGTGSYSVTVIWNTPGPQTISVNYTNSGGCSALIPAINNVIVNTLPVPTISGPSSVCAGATGVVYSTQTGFTQYTWSVSSGGTITAGSGTYSITVTWTTAGAQTVSVNYTNTSGCKAASPTVKNVTVNPLPVPTITGPGSVCPGTAGVVYTTETGMTGYYWSISSGGTIIAGNGTYSVTVAWINAGAQTLSVNYTNTNGCTATGPTVKNVTVNALPVPTISGLIAVCTYTTGVVYTTQTGMTNYTWSISSGGTITAGAGTYQVTVTWTTAGAQTISVNYTNSNGCTAAQPTVRSVSVNPRPSPTISGSSTVCAGVTGVVYTTESQMTGYTWSISSGGTITAGSGTYSVTVTWSTAGAQTISVNYSNFYGCAAINPTVKNVTVNSLPAPTITGPPSVCPGTTAVTYTTEPGMNYYYWVISSGGTILSGSGTNNITVAWFTVGAQTLSVNYYNANGCTAQYPTIKNVTVNALPVPTIYGPTSVCVGATGVIYYTQSGMTGYTWTVSAGGTITSGAGTNNITVSWNTAGTQTVTVNYTNTAGCTASSATYLSVIVRTLPVPTITGSSSVCAGTTGVVYYTESQMTGYTWSVSSGGTITAGSGSYKVTVTWSTAGAQTISVNYSNYYGCSAVNPTIKNVTVKALPTPTITGPTSVCTYTTGNVYTTETGMTGYTWSVSSGGSITAGAGTYHVTVTWSTVGTQTISVNYYNTGGCKAYAPTVQNVTVKQRPTPTITGATSVCAGSTGVTYVTESGMTGYTWTVSTGGIITGGAGTNMITVTWNTVGTQSVTVNYTGTNGCAAIYPATKTVTVNALPVPTISGSASTCAGTAGVIYYTQTGKIQYTWSISSGGIITGGAGTYVVTVTWTTAGSQWIKVNYANSYGCMAATPTQKNVTVNSLPAPTITGPSSLCAGAAGVYTTQPGMTGYTWTFSPGYTILGGGNSSSYTVTVKWTTAGADWVKVNYSNSTGCRAVYPTQFNVTVNALPVPTITGTTPVCQGTTNVLYKTQAGYANYIWIVSTGGVITSGQGNDSVYITWNGYGTQQYVRVYCTNTAGCTGSSATFYVAVNPATVPTISGPSTVCANAIVSYLTDAGKSNYIWTISPGGTILQGQGTKQIYVQWLIQGQQTIAVIYTTTSGCPVLTPTIKSVNVYPIPTPTISGPTTVCVSAYQTYTTEAGMTNYQWSLGGSGGIIYSGFGTNHILVQWIYPGQKTVSVNYTNTGGCYSTVPPVLNVTVNTCPDNPATGIPPLADQVDFTVYPNPNDGQFNAAIVYPEETMFNIEIYDLTGVMVYRTNDFISKGRSTQVIDLKSYPSGIYSVVLRGKDHLLIRKIIINK